MSSEIPNRNPTRAAHLWYYISNFKAHKWDVLVFVEIPLGNCGISNKILDCDEISPNGEN